MKTYIADTHSLLWYFARPERLGNHARLVFDEVAHGTANLIVPAIVIAELIFTVENKPVRANIDEILQALLSSPNVTLLDLTVKTTMRLQTLTAIPEMHDRLIVADAIEHQVILITYDKAITDSGLVEIVW